MSREVEVCCYSSGGVAFPLTTVAERRKSRGSPATVGYHGREGQVSSAELRRTLSFSTCVLSRIIGKPGVECCCEIVAVYFTIRVYSVSISNADDMSPRQGKRRAPLVLSRRCQKFQSSPTQTNENPLL